MHVLSIAAIALMATSPILAQDIDNSDIPTRCATVCSNLVAVSDDCDRMFDNDRSELNCVCQATNAQQIIPLCAACVSWVDQNEEDDDDDDDDNDIQDLRTSCSFSSTIYDPSTTYTQVAMTAATSGANTTTLSGSRTMTSQTSTGTQGSSSMSGASATATGASQTDNTAPAITPGPRIEGVGALAGAALLVAAAWV